MKKSKIWLIIIQLVSLFYFSQAIASAQTIDKYLWEKSAIGPLPANVVSLTQILQSEVEQILTKSSLAPLRMNYSDATWDGYWIYLERGRIITTLAYAYPYLTSGQQQRVKTYVQTHLASGVEALWKSTGPTKGNGEGEERRLHQYPITSGNFPRSGYNATIPTLHVLYGLWLYGERTGDWATIQNYWNQIKSYYTANKNTAVLYGQLSGFVGMARLARQFSDSAMQSTIVNDAGNQFSQALNLSTIESRQQTSIYGYFYQSRKTSSGVGEPWTENGYFPGQPWMFLESSPEIMRFIANQSTLRIQVLGRINQFEGFYDHWWVHQDPIFTRWTGDEGVGVTSETFGIMMPISRWLKQTPPDNLADFVRGAPVGIGDSYWIESLVTAIEAYGQTCWQDIRTSQETCEAAPVFSPGPSSSPTSTPPPKPGDANVDGVVDGFDYVIWLLNYDSTTTAGYTVGDFSADGFVDGFDYVIWLNNYGT